MSTQKVGILSVMLVIPALIVLFLYFFGENKFTLEIIEDDESQGVLMKYSSMSNPECPQDTLNGHRIPDFSLLDQNGDSVNLKTFAGKVLISNFFFSTCTNICLDMSSQLSRVQSAFLNQNDVIILSHTVDPQTDTPEKLSLYAKTYQAQSSHWRFLTGSREVLYDLAKCGYFLPVFQTNDPNNLFAHSDKVILVDKERVVRGIYQGTDREDMDRLITEVKILLKEYYR
jgi:protein SCO1/2